jgi:1-acyl-sn-glycerol-3-phosphate acyltransferase
MQQAREISSLDSSGDLSRSREVGGLLDAARYFGAVTIFALGAVCFYLFIVIRTSCMETSKAQTLVRRTIHNGARLLFYTLERLSLVHVSEGERGALRPHIDRPSVVVANHPSLLDALLILSMVPNGVCIMKRALRSVPVISGFARRAGYIPYSEAPELIQAATAELKRGGVVIIFPEGTRSPCGGCGSLQRGAVRVALEADVPLEVFGLRMQPVVLGRGLPWWRPPRAPILYQVVRLDSVRFEIDRSEGAPERARAESIKGTQWLEERLKSWVS